MQVTAVSGNVLTVSRHQAGTPSGSPVIGNYVMSTPLPTVGTPPATVEQMCIIEQGFMTYTPDPDTGAPRAFYYTTVFDIGDGWMNPE